MSLIEFTVLLLNVAMTLTIFALGLNATLGDASFLFQRPRQLLPALFSMYVAMSAFAVLLAGERADPALNSLW